jgi:hypothetical protein
MSTIQYYPTSYQQQREWLIQKMNDTFQVFNMNLYVEIPFLDMNNCESLLRALIAKHEIFRTSFEVKNGQLCQKVLPANDVKVEISYKNLSACTHRDEALKKIINSETKMIFDLEQFPLYKPVWIKMNDNRNIVLITFHHAIIDFNSIELLKIEMQNFMQSLGNPSGQPSEMDLAQFSDYADLQNKFLSKERMKIYWLDKLKKGIPDLAIIRPEKLLKAKEIHHLYREAVYNKFNINEHFYDYCLEETVNRYNRHPGADISYTLSPEDSQTLKLYANSNNIPIPDLLMASLSLLFFHQARQTQLAINIGSIIRPKKSFDNTLGWLTQEGVYQIEIDSNDTLGLFLKKVSDEKLEVYKNCLFPYGSLCAASPKLSLRKWASPILFNYLVTKGYFVGIEEYGFFKHNTNNITASFDLSLNFYQFNDALQLRCRYRSDLFDSEEIEAHFKVFFKILLGLCECELNIKLIDFSYSSSSFIDLPIAKEKMYEQCA